MKNVVKKRMKRKSLSDWNCFLSVNWANFLPPFQDKNIIKIGTRKTENIKSYISWNCKSLICVGPQGSDFSLPSIAYHKDLQCLEENKYDICIIDEIDFFSDINSLCELHDTFGRIFNLLNSKGVMLIALPNEFLFLKYKFAIRKSAADVGFVRIDMLLCAPSFYEPIIVYPFSQDKKFTLKMLFKYYFEKRELVFTFKSAIKYFFAKMNPLINPFLDPVFIMGKSPEMCEERRAEKLLSCNYHQTGPIFADKIYSVWRDTANGKRQVGLMYYGENENKKLLAVCKQSNSGNERSDFTRQEYEKLILLSKYDEIFKSSGVLIPKPICFEANSGKFLLIESALVGHSLRKYNQKLKGKIDVDYLDMLDRLVDIQIFVQNLLTKEVKDQLPKISAIYFENSMNFPYTKLNNINRIHLYKDYVQHGDFTCVNILYDDAENTWGIIDWEWLAAGLPPLFDIFYLFSSLEYRANKKKNELFLDHCFNSFTETFFKKNSYSDFVRNAILKYCKRFNLNNTKTFDYLLDFLLFHYNKYCLFQATETAKLYENLLMFAIKNKDRFIVQ